MLNLDVVIEERFEKEIDRAIEYLKRGYENKANFNIGNKILQQAYDKYFQRTNDSYLKAKCLRNLSKVYGLLNNNFLEREYSKELYWVIKIYDPFFKDNNTLYYCLSMNEYSQTFKNELTKEELISIEEFNLKYYSQDKEAYYYDICMATFNICLLKEEFDNIILLIKDIHTRNNSEAIEALEEILPELETANRFYYRQAKDLLNMSNSLQVV
ncbi:MAG: hypothetical protein ACRCVJ_18800 [Clostridium sp.]|uniref:hypothetical protein n=1 Tax=Clostridium sp. TaxID=1506 RepID=UPI003F3AB04A